MADELIPSPSNPLFKPDETHGAPRLLALEGYIGGEYIDWRGNSNPAEQRAREIEREQLKAQAKAHRAKSRKISAVQR